MGWKEERRGRGKEGRGQEERGVEGRRGSSFFALGRRRKSRLYAVTWGRHVFL